jgi:signal transduction histidine kinase
MKASLNKRKLNIQMVAPEGMEAFSGDRIRLHQSLSELVQNSVRNTKDGGEIVLGAKQEDGTVIFSVRDNGIGISEEEQGKIFEPFYEIADVELHTTSSSKFGGGGMGIGLPLVKRVVEAHGGTIRLDSALGKGACFEIVLPAGITPVKNGFHDKLLE